MVFAEGTEDFDNPPTFNSTSLTLISSQSTTGDNADTKMWVYGMVSPGAVTDSVAVDFSGTSSVGGISAVNIGGTVTTSVADATNEIANVQNTSASATCVLASGGSSGNGLIAGFVGQDGDSNPMTWSDSFIELRDEDTGTGSQASSLGIGVAYKLSGLPSGTTVTPGISEENSCILVELVAAAGGGFPAAVFIQQNIVE